LCCEPDSDQGISGSTAQPSSVALIYRLPFVLTLIGIFVIFLGVKYQEERKEDYRSRHMPHSTGIEAVAAHGAGSALGQSRVVSTMGRAGALKSGRPKPIA